MTHPTTNVQEGGSRAFVRGWSGQNVHPLHLEQSVRYRPEYRTSAGTTVVLNWVTTGKKPNCPTCPTLVTQQEDKRQLDTAKVTVCYGCTNLSH